MKTKYVVALVLMMILAVQAKKRTKQSKKESIKEEPLFAPKTTSEDSVIVVTEIEQLMQAVHSAPESGSVVLFCGKDLKAQGESPCPKLYEVFGLIGPQLKKHEINPVYYDLNVGDPEILEYFNPERVPYIIYTRSGKYWIFMGNSLSPELLAKFISFSEANSDVLWRPFPKSKPSSFTSMLESVNRFDDKLFLLTRNAPWVYRLVRWCFVGLGLMFLYALVRLLMACVNVDKNEQENGSEGLDFIKKDK
jgi:hypothetical protein